VVRAGFYALANANETHSFIDGILGEYALMPKKQ
jgi:hypothetical protein